MTECGAHRHTHYIDETLAHHAGYDNFLDASDFRSAAVSQKNYPEQHVLVITRQ